MAMYNLFQTTPNLLPSNSTILAPNIKIYDMKQLTKGDLEWAKAKVPKW
jgi:hypothetical protein